MVWQLSWCDAMLIVLTGDRHSPLLGCISSICDSGTAGRATAREVGAAAVLPGLGRPMLPRPWGTVEVPPAAASVVVGCCWLAAAAAAARCASMPRPMLRPAVVLVRPPAQHPKYC